METIIWKNSVGTADECIRQGQLVAVPTETVYGLAGDGLNEKAVAAIYEVKGRPAVKPLSLMVAGPEWIDRYTHDAPPQAFALARRFWPGPLTIVLPAKGSIPEIVLAGGKTVGLRCPDSALTLELIRKAERPLAAPSANLSGEPSPKDAETVLSTFCGKIAGVIDGGHCTLGVESTILDMSRSPFRILRQGALSEEKIRQALLEQMKVIGLTGTTGSGKTTVLAWLQEQGAFGIDCDALYHEMLLEHIPLRQALKQRFPACFVGDSGPDRKILSEIVFSDAEALHDLNRITHRFILEEIRSRLEEAAMQGRRLAVIDAVELFSSGAADLCSFTAAVLSSADVRKERIVKRDGISAEEAEKRIRAQKPDGYYVQHCDVILRNDADKGALISECRELLGGIVENE